MPRCTKVRGLTVHHILRTGTNNLSNAEVLCPKCHQATSSYGTPGVTPPPFTEETKQKALIRAKNRCECKRKGGCH